MHIQNEALLLLHALPEGTQQLLRLLLSGHDETLPRGAPMYHLVNARCLRDHLVQRAEHLHLRQAGTISLQTKLLLGRRAIFNLGGCYGLGLGIQQ